MPQYAFDPTAALPDNKITNEVRSITQVSGIAGTGYAVIPNAAPFYRQGFALVRKSNGDILTEGVDYDFIYPWTQATDWIGKDVFGGFIFTDPNFNDDVAYTYQTIGGTYVENHPATRTEGFKQIGTVLSLDWSTLPETFPPTPHSHPLENLEGMQQIYTQLTQIKEAIESPERAIALEDITDIDAQFITPILQSLSQVESQVAAYGPYAPAISSLQTKMADLWPYSSITETNAHFSIPIAGFFHIRVGSVTFTPGVDEPNQLGWAAFPNKTVYFNASVSLDDTNTTYADGHTVEWSKPNANGITSLQVSVNNWDGVETATRRLYYIAVGV